MILEQHGFEMRGFPYTLCLVAQSCPALCDRMDPMGFSRQEYWSGLPCPPPGDLSKPGIELGSPALQVASLPAELPGNLLYTSFCLFVCFVLFCFKLIPSGVLNTTCVH